MLTSAFLVKFLMNIVILHTTVTLMLTVATPKDLSTVRVILVTLETESPVLVIILSHDVSFFKSLFEQLNLISKHVSGSETNYSKWK